MEISSVSASPVTLPDLTSGLRSAAPVSTGTGATAVADLGQGASGVPGTPPATVDLKAALEAGSKALQGMNQSLEFQLDPDTRQSVVKVVDTQTNEVIQQIPSEQFLQMAQGIDAFQTQLIRDQA